MLYDILVEMRYKVKSTFAYNTGWKNLECSVNIKHVVLQWLFKCVLILLLPKTPWLDYIVSFCEYESFLYLYIIICSNNNRMKINILYTESLRKRKTMFINRYLSLDLLDLYKVFPTSDKLAKVHWIWNILCDDLWIDFITDLNGVRFQTDVHYT